MKLPKHLRLPEGESQSLVPERIDATAAHTELIVPMSISAPPRIQTESTGLGELTGHLWQNKLLIGGAAVLGLAVGAVAALYSTPVYRAQTILQLEGFSNEGLYRELTPVSPQLPNAPPEHYLQNQVKLLRSDTLALRVGEKLGIKPVEQSGGLGIGLLIGKKLGAVDATPEQQRIRAVQRAMDVKTSVNSEVMEVYFRSTDAVKAATGANTIVEEFIELNKEYRHQHVTATTEWLTRQAAELKARLEKTSQALQDYAAASGLVFSGPDDHSTLAKERMRLIEGSLAAAAADRAQVQARYEAVKAATPSVLPDALVSEGLRRAEGELQGLRRQLAEMKTLYTPEHQKVRSLEAQIAELERGIGEGRKDAVGRLHTEYQAAAGREQRIARVHEEQLRTLQGQADRGARYNLLKREVETTQRLYDEMQQKEKEAGMMAALRTTNVRVIDKAQTPLKPYEPNLPLNSALGFALGTVGGIVVAVARRRPDVVRQPGDTAELNIPELGAIPSAKADFERGGVRSWLPAHAGNGGQLELVTWKEDRSLLSESFRATLASILFCSESRNRSRIKGTRAVGQLLVVTSVQPTDGKTTVVSNLAIALAETNRKVLLIDADMRRPRIHSIFDVCNDWGLSDLLQGNDNGSEMPIESMYRPTRIPNLWILPSGPGTAAISKLLYSSQLKKVLVRYRSCFDLILIDTPPMKPYSDARVIGRHTDGVVVVVRANRTCRESLKTVCARLMQDGIPVLGTVLNDWTLDSDSHRAYSHYYKNS